MNEGQLGPVDLDDIRPDERRLFAGVYMCNAAPQADQQVSQGAGAASPQPDWQKLGKGYVGLRHQQKFGTIVLFVVSATNTSEVIAWVRLNANVSLCRRQDTSLEWLEQGSSFRYALTFADASQCAEVASRANAVAMVERNVPDAHGRQFWYSIANQSTQVEWNTFVQGIFKVFGATAPGDLNMLRSVLRVTTDSPFVTVEAFGGLLLWFGNFDESLARMRDTYKQPWFKGFISRAEAEQMLTSSGLPGSYLIRFSASQPGCFALSYVNAEWSSQQVRHILISPALGGSGYVLQCADGTALVYTSLQDVVERESSKLKFPCALLPSEDSGLFARLPKVAVYSLTKEGWGAPVCAGYLSHRYEQNVQMREGLLSGVMLRVQPAEPTYAPYQVLFTAATDVSCETERAIMWTEGGARMALSFEQADQCAEVWEKVSECRLVTPELQAAELWRQNGWNTAAAVVFTEFFTALRRRARGPLDEVEPYIRYIVFYGRPGTESVTLTEATRLLAWFGPIADMVQRLQEVVNAPWFHWFITREQAISMLENQPAGTFLLRFASDARSFALSFVDELPGGGIALQHTLIRRCMRPGAATYSMSTVGRGDADFSSLTALVQMGSDHLRCPCPRAAT